MDGQYTLVAWTDHGQLRMIPSLVEASAKPFKERIDRLEQDDAFALRDEVGWLIERSCAYETLACYYLRMGCTREAFDACEQAALVCACCSDRLWLQGSRCDFPALPLLGRFHAMHARCRELARNNPTLRFRYRESDVRRWYVFFTTDEREDWRELSEELATARAFRFGRR
jgi:hypothetical protein